jgi:hypothetical protein
MLFSAGPTSVGILARGAETGNVAHSGPFRNVSGESSPVRARVPSDDRASAFAPPGQPRLRRGCGAKPDHVVIGHM